MKSILITGGAGFIGNHLVRKYLAMDYHVHVLDDFSTGLEENLPSSSLLTIHHRSILDSDYLSQFKDLNLIIHLASIVGMKKVKEDAHLTYITATTGTENVLDQIKDVPVVLFSSSAVYGMCDTLSKQSEQSEISEEGLLRYDGGIPGYATGKRHMELIGLNRAEAGRKILIVRPFNVIGKHQLSDYGMVVPKFIKAAINNAPLTIYGNGRQSRCFSDVDTFSDVIIKLIQCKNAWADGGNIINIGNDRPTIIQSLAETTVALCESQSLLEYVPYNHVFKGQLDVQGRIPDTSKFTGLMGPVQWPGIEKTINKIFNSYLIEKQC